MQVNAAVDDAASMAEDVARLLSAARNKGKLTAAERKRAQSLIISVAVRACSPRMGASSALSLGMPDMTLCNVSGGERALKDDPGSCRQP